MAFILTRIHVGDYDAWKTMFDKDVPGARTESKGWRIFRSADDPNEVFIQVEFESVEGQGTRFWVTLEGVGTEVTVGPRLLIVDRPLGFDFSTQITVYIRKITVPSTRRLVQVPLGRGVRFRAA